METNTSTRPSSFTKRLDLGKHREALITTVGIASMIIMTLVFLYR